MMRRRLIWLWVGSVLLAAQANAVDLPLYPFAKIIAQGTEEPAPREFVWSAVEKIKREASVERQVAVTAARRWVTYELPMDAQLSAVQAHYAQALRGQVVFDCQGRDCGRSNTWANAIFGQARLYGRDTEQAYFAAVQPQTLVSVYLIKRGNRRQYAHVEYLTPNTMPALQPLAQSSDDWLGRLSVAGYVELTSLRPSAEGQLEASVLDQLTEIGQELGPLASEALQVVCHLYSAQTPVAQLLVQSQTCAEQALAALRSGLRSGASDAANAGANYAARGVGPLAPQAERAAPKLVLVLPQRLTR